MSDISQRQVASVRQGRPSVDGAGVHLTRLIGEPGLSMLDPFLLLDCFESDNASDYIGGFPDHPHRGFETVTYLLHGRMRHKDNAGHEGLIEPGGVQWMTAGKGIVHSEMPEQEDGLLQGFQLWLNLPASHKMTTPAYQEFSAEEIPEESGAGYIARVIAGTTDRGIRGPVTNVLTNPTFLDVSLNAGSFRQSLPPSDNAFIYVISGQLSVGNTSLTERQIAVLTSGDSVTVSTPGDTRFLLVAGTPLAEPVVRGGPFVMNSRAELLQAFEDFQNNRF